MDTSGFYKLDGAQLLYGPNFVLNADYQLYREGHNDRLYSYPVDGWRWFESEQEARSFLGL